MDGIARTSDAWNGTWECGPRRFTTEKHDRYTWSKMIGSLPGNHYCVRESFITPRSLLPRPSQTKSTYSIHFTTHYKLNGILRSSSAIPRENPLHWTSWTLAWQSMITHPHNPRCLWWLQHDFKWPLYPVTAMDNLKEPLTSFLTVDTSH